MENKDDDEGDRPERRIPKGVVPEAMFNFQFGSSMVRLMELPLLLLLPWWARIRPLQGTEMKRLSWVGGGVVEGATRRLGGLG